MDWSIFGMAVLELFALKEQLQQVDADPMKLSFAQVLDAVRTSLQHLGRRRANAPDIATALRAALVDSYERKAAKAARHKSTKKTKPSCGHPMILAANSKQRKIFKNIEMSCAT